MTLNHTGLDTVSVLKYYKRTLFLTNNSTSSDNITVLGEMEETLWLLLANSANITTKRNSGLTAHNTTTIRKLGVSAYAKLIYVLGARII